MEEIELKLFELLNLEIEICGLTDHETKKNVFNGLLSQNLEIITKYWLTDFVDNTLKNEKKLIEVMNNDLIKKHGTETEDGKFEVKSGIVSDEIDENGDRKTITNPNFINYQNDYNKLLQETKTIKIPKIKLEDLKGIKTTENYGLIFKYLVKKPEIENL